MQNTLKKLTVIAISIALVASIFACIPFGGVAYADSIGTTWGSKNTSTLWYYKEGYLNVQGIKNIVATWDLSKVTEPIVIAVVDTGIVANHEIFDGVLLENENGEVLGFNSYDAYMGNSKQKVDVADEEEVRHGTQVASIMAMLIKELGLEDYIKLLPVKASNKESKGWVFKLDSIVEALELVSSGNVKIDVVNMSLGLLKSEMTTPDWSTHKGLQYAINLAAQKAVVVAAAGNKLKDSKNANDVFYPAALDGVVSVMGYDSDGALFKTSATSGSNYGNAYDLIAPAEGIFSATNVVGSTQVYNNAGLDGTSAAAPFVSVAAALLKLKYVAQGGSVPSANSLARMLNNVDGGFVEYGTYDLRRMDIVALLTQNWAETDFDYKDPVGIYVSYPDEYKVEEVEDLVYMLADQIVPLTLTAQINPYGETNPNLDDLIVWFVRDENGNEQVIGGGTSVIYAPSQGGEYLVGARIKYDQTTYEDAFAWSVEFLPYVAGDVRVTYADLKDEDESQVPKSGVVYTKEDVTFALTGLVYADTREKITWYVNGEKVAEGFEFKLDTSKAGKYLITAKYGNENVITDEQGFEVEVKHFLLRPLDLSMLTIGLAIVIAVVVTVSVLATKHKKKKEE